MLTMKTLNTTFAPAALIIGLASLWPASIFAAEPTTSESEPASDARSAPIEKASEAASEAAADAIDSIAKDAVRDLDVRLIGLNLAKDSAAITIAAN